MKRILKNIWKKNYFHSLSLSLYPLKLINPTEAKLHPILPNLPIWNWCRSSSPQLSRARVARYSFPVDPWLRVEARALSGGIISPSPPAVVIPLFARKIIINLGGLTPRSGSVPIRWKTPRVTPHRSSSFLLEWAREYSITRLWKRIRRIGYLMTAANFNEPQG